MICIQRIDRGIPMGTNCAPLLADIFLYSYEAEFIQTLIKSGKRHLAKSFNFTYRYIDDVLSLNNHKFSDYVYDIYPVELEIRRQLMINIIHRSLTCYLKLKKIDVSESIFMINGMILILIL